MYDELKDPTLDSLERVNQFLRESPDPTTEILTNVEGIHATLAEVLEATDIKVEIDINNRTDYKRLFNAIAGDINFTNASLAKEYGLGEFKTRVMTNDEMFDPENDNISEVLPTNGGNPEEATVGLLILKKSLQTHMNEQLFYVPNPNELMITLGGD